MSEPAMARNMIASVARIRRQMRKLNAASMGADGRKETAGVPRACVHEPAVAHSMLPPALRHKSRILSVERYAA
jgi:hypothetical protein